MGRTLEIDNAVDEFSNIQEEIIRLTNRALEIVKEQIDANASPKWHKIITRTANYKMEDELADLENEAIEQEEQAIDKEVKELCQKHSLKASDKIKEEMASQGFSIKETKQLVIIETPCADYPFSKETGTPLEPKV